jgi:hypothetical protein
VRRTVQYAVVSLRGAPGRMRLLALATIAVVSWLALGATASAGAATPASVIQAAKAAIATQTGVHVLFVARAHSTSKTEEIVADIGRTSGEETISLGSARLAIRVTPTRGYASGNISGLTTLFGLTPAQAKKAGADWVTWKAGTTQYGDLKEDVTMPSVNALFPKAAGTKLASKVTGGVAVFALTWTVAATGSTPTLKNALTVSATGATLPVEATSTESDGTNATTTLSRWDEPVVVVAPPAASSIASAKVTG